MTTATATLADFLLARVIDDIVLARAIQAQAVTDGFMVDDPRRPELTLAARVLADCAARRAIVEMHPCDDCGMGDDPCPTLRYLAAPYASHESFDPAWAVS